MNLTGFRKGHILTRFILGLIIYFSRETNYQGFQNKQAASGDPAGVTRFTGGYTFFKLH
jgi:hypothetical protein